MSDSQLPERHRTRFPEISSRTWEHPADRAALTALRTMRGFDTLLATISGLLRERQYRLVYLANAVRVDATQLPRLHELLVDCARCLDIDELPELYVQHSPQFNAMALGMDRPFIVLTSALVGELDDEELRFVIGHELGHIASGHAVYRSMLKLLIDLSRNMGFLPVAPWVLRGIIAAMLEWWRKAELSGDRAGMLCAQDDSVALRVQMKTAGGQHVREMNPDSFLRQAREYERSGDLRDGVLKLLNLELSTHPFPVLRAAALRRWIDDGSYGKILAGDYLRRGEEGKISEDWTEAAADYRQRFTDSEDPFFRFLRENFSDLGATARNAAGNAAAGLGSLGRRFRRGWDGSDADSGDGREDG